jgi:hypothetical protein
VIRAARISSSGPYAPDGRRWNHPLIVAGAAEQQPEAGFSAQAARGAKPHDLVTEVSTIFPPMTLNRSVIGISD